MNEVWLYYQQLLWLYCTWNINIGNNVGLVAEKQILQLANRKVAIELSQAKTSGGLLFPLLLRSYSK